MAQITSPLGLVELAKQKSPADDPDNIATWPLRNNQAPNHRQMTLITLPLGL
ncbi:hypothetical protein DPMN_149702 [Dreissena polymorpha]|uniref:Uncharacterized protein n=1 Tax=Dreissena polymorpha TaxID=45954 RepID=A0A9D4FC96_DREPO|nr:hypothetical protein DPMN_149702 [Dreissena polymorpha]